METLLPGLTYLTRLVRRDVRLALTLFLDQARHRDLLSYYISDKGLFKRWRLERLEVFDIILVKVKVRDPRLILQKIEETSKNQNQRREIYNRKIDFVEKFIRAKVIEPYRSRSFLAERNT